MLKVEVRITHVDRLLARIRGVDILSRAFDRVQGPIREALATYPPPSRKPQRFVSEKQRRYFFWALRAGRIQVPYNRSGNLGRGWRGKILLRGNEVALSVTNAVDYAEGVMGKKQWRYHAGTWPKAQDIVKKFEPAVRAVVLMEEHRMATGF